MTTETITIRVRVYASGERFALADHERTEDKDRSAIDFDEVVPSELQTSDIPFREFDVVVPGVELPSFERPAVTVAAPPLEAPALGGGAPSVATA